MLDQRKKVVWAAAGSVGLHLLVLLLWALTIQWLPNAEKAAGHSPEPTPEPIKVTLEQEKPDLLPVPTPTPTPPPSRFVDTHDLAETATPPPNSSFESARNTAAASELPPEGDAPLPTQKGREVPSFVVQTHRYVDGADEPPAAPANTPPPPVETSPPLPRAVPQPPRPALAATVAPTPAPTAPSQPGELALAQPSSIPAEPSPAEANPYDPSVRTPTSLTEPPRPTPVRSARGGYQPQQYKTAISGSVSNRGASSVASAATPMGRYRELVINTIGRRWNAYIGKRNDLASTGSVTIQFLIGMDGKARGTKVVASTANEAFASLSLQAILDSKMPPMPADAVPNETGGQLPVELTFEFVDPNF